MKNKTFRLLTAVALSAGIVAPTAFAPIAPTAVRAADAPPQAAVDAKLQAAIDKGLAFLKSQQQPDGGWQTGSQPPAITALALKAFAQDPKTGPTADFVKRGYDKLLTYQLDNGGIYADLLANYNTSIAVATLAAAKNPAYQEKIDKAVAYIKGIQWTDKTGPGPKGEKLENDQNVWWGGWGYSRAGRPDLSNAQMAIEALENAGLKKDDPAFQEAIKFITRTQNNSETNKAGEKWAGDDGGFVYSPANDGESQAGAVIGPDGKKALRSYGSMTYAGLKSMLYAGLGKDDARVKAAWRWISNNYTIDVNPGFPNADPKQGDMSKYGVFYYYHTMARALNVYDEPTITDAKGVKHDWRAELTDKLASLQQPDGSWSGLKKWNEDIPVMTTSLAVLALQEVQRDLKEHPAK